MQVVLTDVTVRIPDRPEPLFVLPRLELGSGSHVLVHGPSGRGKTTLLNLVAGQFRPHAGSVRVGDTELTALDADARARFRRRHMGIIFQRWNLVDHLTVLENILLGLPADKPRRRDHALDALRAVGLDALAGRRGGLLSPGEQQRVAVARVRAAAPDLILADEPTSSLDDPGAAMVLDALEDAARGRTLVVVSHDPRARARFPRVHDFTSLVSTPGAAP